MERKFNKYGKPLPNKSDIRSLPYVDKIIRKRLPDYIEGEFEDWYHNLDENRTHNFYNEVSKGYYDNVADDITDLAQKVANGENIKNSKGDNLYVLLLKKWMTWFYKDADYMQLGIIANSLRWERGWIPDIMSNLGFNFDEAYALLLLWFNEQLKKYGISIPEIESSIKENDIKNLIKTILKEQIVKNDHSICGILTCNKLDEVLNKIEYKRLSPLQKEKLEKIKSNYKRDVINNLKNVPKSGGLKGATGDSEKDFCDEYLSQIQTLICEPTQK